MSNILPRIDTATERSDTDMEWFRRGKRRGKCEVIQKAEGAPCLIMEFNLAVELRQNTYLFSRE